jgi:hypothetical protein
MFKKILVFIPIALSFSAFQAQALTLPIPQIDFLHEAAENKVLAEREMSLTDRYAVPVVNDVFADNILLTLSYLSSKVTNARDINWVDVRKPQVQSIVLKPGKVFAFQDAVLPEFADKTVITTHAHFSGAEGFRSSGYLYGDGVCHLASLLNWVAKDAGLRVVAPVKHDFAKIPDVPREYGTSIYYTPEEKDVSEQQNLYIQNTYDKSITIVIYSQKDKVRIVVDKNK